MSLADVTGASAHGAASETETQTPGAKAPATLSDRAYAAYRAERYDQAVSLFQKALSVHYADEPARLGLGLSLASSGERDAGLSVLENTVAAFPKSWIARYDLAVAQVQAGNDSAAVRPLVKAMKIANSGQLERSARLLVTLNPDPKTAAASFAEVVRAWPESVWAFTRYGYYLERSGGLGKAQGAFYRALGIDAGYAPAAELLSGLYARQNAAASAQIVLENAYAAAKAERNRPDQSRLLTDLAGRTSGKDPGRILTLALEALQADKTNRAAWYTVLITHLKGGDLPGAMVALGELHGSGPESPYQVLGEAQVMAYVGNWKGAAASGLSAKLLKTAAGLGGPAAAEADDLAALFFLHSQRRSKALNAVSRALVLDPSNLGYMREKGLLEYTLGSYADAVQVLEQLPGPQRNVTALSALGASLIKTGRAAEAIPILKKLTVQAPGDADAWYNLAVAQGKNGDQAAATKSFAKSVSLRR